METIHFFTEDVSFELQNSEASAKWLEELVHVNGQTLEVINIIFCSDDYLLDINKNYLQHDYYTDIITFDQRDDESAPLESDIFISLDRVADNAQQLGVDMHQELHRVMAHGLLHIMGWNDKTEAEKKAMREKEEASLSLHPNYKN